MFGLWGIVYIYISFVVCIELEFREIGILVVFRCVYIFLGIEVLVSRIFVNVYNKK